MSDTPKTDEIIRIINLVITTRDPAVWNTFRGSVYPKIAPLERAARTTPEEGASR